MIDGRNLAETYAAGTQALRDHLDADMEAREARAEAAADEWTRKRHPFVADEYGTFCSLCWRPFTFREHR